MTDEQRWADAESLLDGTATPSVEKRLDQAQLRMGLRIGGLVLGAVVVVAVLFVLLDVGDDGGSAQHAPGQHSWRFYSILALYPLSLVCAVISLVASVRSGEMTSGWRAPELVLDRGGRTALRAELTGRRAARGEHLRVTRDAAARRVRQGRASLWLQLGIGVQFLAQAIGATPGRGSSFAACVLVLPVLAGPALLVRTRRARRFLDEHPLPDDEPVTAPA